MGFLKDLFASKNAQSQPQQTTAQAYGEMASGIFDGLSIEQRGAILCTQFMFAGFTFHTPAQNVAMQMVESMQTALRLNRTEAEMYSAKFNEPEKLISMMKTINNQGAMDLIVYNSYGLVALSGRRDGIEVLYKFFSELGYSQQDVNNVVDKIEALGNMMRNV